MTWNRQSQDAGPGHDPDDPSPPGGSTDPSHPPAASTTDYNVGDDEGSIRVLEAGRLLNQDGVPVQEPASRIEVVAIDEFLVVPLAQAATTVSAESPPHLENILGLYDQMAIQAVVDYAVIDVGTQPMLTVDIYHSADGLKWVKKVGAGVHAIIPFPVSTSGTTYVPIGYDDGTSPSLAFVKVIATITTNKAANISAHVNVRLTCNDAREAQFARQLAREYKREHKNLPAEYWKRQGARWKECTKGLAGERSYLGATYHNYCLHQQRNHPGNTPGCLPFWRVVPGSPAAVKRCVDLGFSHYAIEQLAKEMVKAGDEVERQAKWGTEAGDAWWEKLARAAGKDATAPKDC